MKKIGDYTIKIFALGGLDENGKNCYVVDVNGDLFVFDAGLRYPEETLLGVDSILPGINYLFAHRDQIKGFFISHAHDENMGAIPYIYDNKYSESIIDNNDDVDEDYSKISTYDNNNQGVLIKAPVFATKLAVEIIKETAKKFNKNVSKINFNNQLYTDNVLPYIKRNDDIIITTENEEYKIHTFAVTHGSGDAVGYALETRDGLIVYSGDFIFDFSSTTNYSAGNAYSTDLSKIYELAKMPVLCLLAESYNSNYKGFVAPNHKLSAKVGNVLENSTNGKVLISLYGQNFFGLEEIINAAKKYRWKIMLYTDYSKQIVNTLDNVYETKFIPDSMINDKIEAKTIVLIMENGNKVFETLVDEDNLNSFNITVDDAIILASPPHTGTEIMFAQILDKLYQTNARIYNFSNKDIVTMHAGSEDLKTLISLFKPKYYMPIRGYYVKMIDNAHLAEELGYTNNNIFVFDNGMVAKFVNGKYDYNNFEGIDKDEIAELMVDGSAIGDVKGVVINDRRKLARDGVITLGISFSMLTRKIVAGPDIQMRGVIFLKNRDEVIEEIATEFEKIVAEYIQRPGQIDYIELRALCRERLAEKVRKTVGKNPMILPVIISIN